MWIQIEYELLLYREVSAKDKMRVNLCLYKYISQMESNSLR